MYASDQTTTVAIRPCRSCGAGVSDESKFCRSCGTAQPADECQSKIPAANLSNLPQKRYATAPLSSKDLYHPVSGPLVSAVVAGVPASTPRSTATSLSKRMLLALMAIPIWVMIILLSPLDAYASAKIIGNRI